MNIYARIIKSHLEIVAGNVICADLFATYYSHIYIVFQTQMIQKYKHIRVLEISLKKLKYHLRNSLTFPNLPEVLRADEIT